MVYRILVEELTVKKKSTSEIETLTVSVEAAASIIGLSRAATYEAVKRGEIPIIRFGKRVRVLRVPLEELLRKPRPLNAA